jgi:hypothetical protein
MNARRAIDQFYVQFTLFSQADPFFIISLFESFDDLDYPLAVVAFVGSRFKSFALTKRQP